jgi:hypothetical protein
MSIIVTRAGKGSPLTNNEVDANFVNLNTDKIQVTGTPVNGYTILWDSATSTWVPGASDTYPSAGIANSTGTAWGTSYSTSGSGTVVALATSAALTTPAITGGSVDNATIGSTTRNTIAGTTELIGPAASANFTRFPGALAVVSNTDAGIQQNESLNVGVMAEAVSSNTTWGSGLYGAGYTNTVGNGRGTGVTGEGHVSAATDTGVAVGVRGYAKDVHTGNYNIGLYGDAENGDTGLTYGGNVSLFLANGNIVTSSAAAKSWYLGGNLIFDGQGTAKTISATNGAVISVSSGITGTLPAANGGTGLSSLGTGVATFLGTPSSANLLAAVTDETGTGALVFATSPTLVTPALGTPSALVGTNITGTAANFNINGTVGATTPSTGNFTALTENGVAVVIQSDIGTAPNQIPLNGTLGSMAFQDEENINFTGGTGALSSLNIAAISAQLNVSALDIFVYDTSKDSDGGLWRKRTQHTSWYNEPLNTATRGSRREFPAVAVIVATANTLYVLDGDDPALPMWMIFLPGGILDWPTSTHYRMAVSAVNGGIVVVTEDGGEWFRFIDDTTYIIYNSLTYNVTSDRSIANRNGATAYNGEGNAINTYAVGSYNMYDVDMTVLQNAPIDAATSLPVPTIAIALSTGVSIIQNTGRVTNITCNNASYTVSRKVTFLDGYGIGLSLENSTAAAEDSFYVFNQIPQTSTVITVDSKSGSPISADAFYSVQFINTANVNLFINGSDAGNRAITKADRLNFGNSYGLTRIAENKSNPSTGMTNFVASKYNSGWMPGNIKGAWLSDNTAETILGTDLYGGVTYNDSGRLASYTYTNGSNTATLTYSSGTDGYLVLNLPALVIGKAYIITFTGNQTYTPTPGYSNFIRVVSTSAVLAQVFDADQGKVATTLSFIAQGSTAGFHTVNIYSKYVGTLTVTFSITEAVLDRSMNLKGLRVFGLITKTPVATNADLVQYGEFGTASYLQQPYNGDLDFGTGDFCYMGWFKSNTGTGGNQPLFWRGMTDANSYAMIEPYIRSDGRVDVLTRNRAETYSYFTSTTNILSQTWRFWCMVRRSGVMYWYIDGKFDGSAVNTQDITPLASKGIFEIGSDVGKGKALPGTVALYRVSATPPSDAQIAKMYNDEKYLFQENSKAVLYGTSDAVTALAYDADTQLLHVGTSSGRSVFDGLRRVDNTTTAVSAAISAADGLVAEN